MRPGNAGASDHARAVAVRLHCGAGDGGRFVTGRHPLPWNRSAVRLETSPRQEEKLPYVARHCRAGRRYKWAGVHIDDRLPSGGWCG